MAVKPELCFIAILGLDSKKWNRIPFQKFHLLKNREIIF